jgi:phosphoribosylformylglycinamidine cyclo-ligase
MRIGMGENLTYKDAGVDTKEGELAVNLMKEHVQKTYDKGVLSGLGGFGSLYQPDLSGIDTPVLVAGSDGVGTKLMIAFMMDKHDTVGQDCVAMCVNDVLCQGAKPLFFLDYIATGRVDAGKIADIVRGVADGCLLAGCALVGGETAEMPGLYGADEYDMAGFCVGLVDRDTIIDGKDVRKGDVIRGRKSRGLHSNGFSLVRKILFDIAGLKVTDRPEGLCGSAPGEILPGSPSSGALSCEETLPEAPSLGEILLTPTRIYTKQVQTILGVTRPKALIHITGGGFFENIPRVLPSGLGVRIRKDAWERPKIFDLIQKLGGIGEKELFSTFNMGIGLMAIVSGDAVQPVLAALAAQGEEASAIGEVISGEGVMVL